MVVGMQVKGTEGQPIFLFVKSSCHRLNGTSGTRLMLRVFFFSSRRRHTRSDRDWSSDVCSSDLSQATRLEGSWARQASSTASEMVSHTLSGWPSPTDSEEKM